MRTMSRLVLGVLVMTGLGVAGGCGEHHPDHPDHDHPMDNQNHAGSGGNGAFGTDADHAGSHDQEHPNGGGM